MTRELEQKIINHNLTYEDVVIGETIFGNPLWNPEIFEYVFENGSNPRVFWDDQNISRLGSLWGYRDLFGSRYSDYAFKKRKANNDK